jgi:hypothetical protein
MRPAGTPALQLSLSRAARNPKRDQSNENREIEREMGSEAPVLARMTETTAGDVEPPHLCDDTCRDETEGQRGQNEQSPTVKESQDKSKAAEQFQPRQIKGQSNADRPRQHFVIVNVDGESKWINGLNHTRVNKDSANEEIHQTPEELLRKALQRFNDLMI